MPPGRFDYHSLKDFIYSQLYSQIGLDFNGRYWTGMNGKTYETRVFVCCFRLCWIVLDVLLVPKGGLEPPRT